MSKNIVLIGFMGVGKTSVGESLAKKIDYDFVDSDNEIEKRSQSKVEDIFWEYGESYFRRIESEVISDISKRERTVISTGGGVVLNTSNISILKKNSFVILLSAETDTILRNISNQKDRPLLKGRTKHDIERIISEREPFYNCFDYNLRVDGLEVEEIVDKALDILKESKII